MPLAKTGREKRVISAKTTTETREDIYGRTERTLTRAAIAAKRHPQGTPEVPWGVKRSRPSTGNFPGAKNGA